MKNRPKASPEVITFLPRNHIFVFGSNLKGVHGKGAAKTAYKKFGAYWGNGRGLMRNSYAIPTKENPHVSLPLAAIARYVAEFIETAQADTSRVYLVTPIGCGLAGYKPSQIAPFFKPALTLQNVRLPNTFINILCQTT